MIYLQLFFVFFKIGAFSFGGGYAMIPFLESEAISRNWLTQYEIIDMIAISQITPGPIATNMATYVGYNQASVLGAIIATLGVSAPSIIIILLITKYLLTFFKTNIKDNIFLTLRPIVLALIIVACFNIAFRDFFPTLNSFNLFEIINDLQITPLIISSIVFIAVYKFKIHPIPMMIFSAITGIIFIK